MNVPSRSFHRVATQTRLFPNIGGTSVTLAAVAVALLFLTLLLIAILVVPVPASMIRFRPFHCRC